jgi:hypothetical protein
MPCRRAVCQARAPCLGDLWTGLRVVEFLCREVGEEVVAMRTPALWSSPCPSTAASACRWSASVLARRGAVHRSPRRACLQAGLRAECFLFLQVLVCTVAAWPGAPQRRA